MQAADEQEQVAAVPEIAPQADSDESKPKRGGKRPGAGRKPNLTKILLKGVSRETILAACNNVDVGAVIIGLLRSKREQSRIEALHFIFDRVMGKPKQDIGLTGGIVHAHVRDPLLAGLPKEALEELLHANNEILARYSRVLDVAQDGPQNQIESKPATEAEVADNRLAVRTPQNLGTIDGSRLLLSRPMPAYWPSSTRKLTRKVPASCLNSMLCSHTFGISGNARTIFSLLGRANPRTSLDWQAASY